MTPEQLIKGIEDLVALPDAVARANELLDSPDASLSEIADVISHDPALSARLLRLVNSAFYGFPRQIDSLSKAISLVGTNELRSLIIAAGTANSFSRLAPEGLDLDSYWHRSVYCGLLAKTLAARTNRGKGEPEFLAGLLHDIGRLVLYERQADTARELDRKHREQNRPLAELEKEVLGFTTAEVGAALLRSWHLPPRITEAVRWQHRPEACENYADEAYTLALALDVTDQVEPRTGTAPLELNEVDSHALQRFDLDQAELEQVAMDASLACFDVLEVVAPTSTTVY